MAVTKISVPKTPKSAFNKNPKKPLTEGQVAARIHELTKALHPQAAHVPLPSARMISHAEEPGAFGGGGAPAGRKPPKKAVVQPKKAAVQKRGGSAPHRG